VNISDGKVSAINGNAVNNNGSGTISISGGTVSGTTGYLVYNYNSAGKITISGTAVVTSADTASNAGTVCISNGQLEITGGTVSNTATGNAIRTTSGAVTFSGGEVLAKSGYAINNAGTGTITLTGGLVFAYGKMNNVINGTPTTSANAAIVAWDSTAGNAKYTAFTGNDIALLPSTSTAKWLNKDGKAGIEYASGTNTGFIPLGVEVAKTTPTYALPSGLTSTVGQTLADVVLPAGWEWESDPEITLVGSEGTRTHKAKFTHSDTVNYNAVGNIDLTVTITAGTPIRLPQIAGGMNIIAQATGKAILLQNLPRNAKVEAYSLQGRSVYLGNSGNSQTLQIAVGTKGMYIVKVNREVLKVHCIKD
jgi:hypothetical protein